MTKQLLSPRASPTLASHLPGGEHQGGWLPLQTAHPWLWRAQPCMRPRKGSRAESALLSPDSALPAASPFASSKLLPEIRPGRARAAPGPLPVARVDPPTSPVPSRFSLTVPTRLETPWPRATTATGLPLVLGHPFHQLSCGRRNLCPAREWVCAPSSDPGSPLSPNPDP